jgi:hypothetical protein
MCLLKNGDAFPRSMPRPCRARETSGYQQLGHKLYSETVCNWLHFTEGARQTTPSAARQGCQSYSQNGVMRIPVSFLVIFNTTQSHDLPAVKGFQ